MLPTTEVVQALPCVTLQISDPLAPLHQRLVARRAITSATWVSSPACLYLTMDDGSLRHLWLSAVDAHRLGEEAASMTFFSGG